jgi:hypothetical protein
VEAFIEVVRGLGGLGIETRVGDRQTSYEILIRK